MRICLGDTLVPHGVRVAHGHAAVERCTQQHHAGGARHQALLRPASATTVLAKDASYWAAWLHHHGGLMRTPPPWGHVSPLWYAQATGGTSWARSVHQCGRNRRLTVSMAMRTPHRGVARTHRSAVLATMMRCRTTVSLATPRWCHPRHCGAVTPPVGKRAHWWDDCTTGGAASASTPLVCSGC